MARYKEYSYSRGKFIPIHFSKQILPCTFEYTLNYLIDNELNLSIFDKKYNNDDIGAPAYDSAFLLKIVLYGYSKGIVSSRKIAQCCRENIIFMALSADTRPHFTTIAEFISSQVRSSPGQTYSTRQTKGECPVEPVLHDPQHEKDSMLWAWICIAIKKNGRMPVK